LLSSSGRGPISTRFAAMAIGGWILLMITLVPGLFLGALGVAPDLAAPSLEVSAEWARAIFALTGLFTGFFVVRAVARELLRAKDDKEARFRRAPFVATGLVTLALALLLVAFAGEVALSGPSAGALRVLVGLYAAWLALFGLPMFFARKLDQIQPVAPAAPTACHHCGTPVTGTSATCGYCGAKLA
jgi:amino acid permease